MKPVVNMDSIFRLAEAFVNQTSCHIFLTGKAGSGKTTFLHHIIRNTSKKAVVVAPTGVAAINAGGMTIHSFFQLPIGIFIPENHVAKAPDLESAVYPAGALLRKVRINKQKRKLIRQLDLLVIDEVSMVRADLMDAMDRVLRHIRQNYQQPFGGVQVLMIGDLYQLPPVVTEQDKPWLSRYYVTPFFFSARVIGESPPVHLELQAIYRQHEEKFIDLLNKIRHNLFDENDLKTLNTYYDPEFRPAAPENYITLCSHHYKANAINEYELDQLSGKLYRYDAEIEGEFNESAAPADQILLLKKGAQVMFIRNDMQEEKRYYNGKIGVISDLDEDEIRVSFQEEKKTILLEKEVWKNIRYTLDETTDHIAEKELGSFTQYPVRLAWAITIHKSQGLTFDRAIIDAGDSFTSGQVYVALSRVKDTKGLVLRTPVEKRSIIQEWQFPFEDEIQDEHKLAELLRNEQKKFMQKIFLKSMEWDLLVNIFREFVEDYQEKQVAYREETLRFGNDCLDQARMLREVAGKFQNQLKVLFNKGESAYPLLAERMESAFDYFNGKLRKGIRDPLNSHFEKMKGKPRVQKYLKILQTLRTAVALKYEEIRQARDLAVGLADGEKIGGLLRQINSEKKNFIIRQEEKLKTQGREKGSSQDISFEMYQKGKTIVEIASERMLTKGTVESHLLPFIRKGELDVSALISREKYQKLVSKLRDRSFGSLSEIKYEMGDAYSYAEIKAALNHLEYKKSKSS